MIFSRHYLYRTQIYRTFGIKSQISIDKKLPDNGYNANLEHSTFGKDIRNTQQWSLPHEMFGYILKQEMFGWSWQ